MWIAQLPRNATFQVTTSNSAGPPGGDYGCLRTNDRWKLRSLPGSFPIFVARVDCLTVHLPLASSRKRAEGLAPSTLHRELRYSALLVWPDCCC